MNELINMFNWAATNPDIANISLSNENGKWSITSVELIMHAAYKPVTGTGSTIEEAMGNWSVKRGK